MKLSPGEAHSTKERARAACDADRQFLDRPPRGIDRLLLAPHIGVPSALLVEFFGVEAPQTLFLKPKHGRSAVGLGVGRLD